MPAVTVAEAEPPEATPSPMAGVGGVGGVWTFPVSATVWGLLGALSAMVRVPVWVPEAEGVKVTWTVQSPAGAPQVFVVANGPEVWRDEIVNGPVPVLATVICCAPLVVPVA